MKILVTGAAGQVGREVVELALASGFAVAAFDSKTLDIVAREPVDAAVARERPDCVINTAAYTAVDRAESDSERAYAVNRDGVANLALACKSANIPLLHISTDYVFDGSKHDAYTEDDAPNPSSVYGASKFAGEKALAEQWEKHIILRVSWVFGRHGNNFVKTMLRLGRERNELNVVDDQFGAPTSAQAIAKLLLDIANHPALGSDQLPWGVRHLESNPGVTWFEFANAIFTSALDTGLIEKKPTVHPITSAEFPTPVQRPANSKLTSIKSWPEGLAAQGDWPRDLDTVLRDLK